MASIHKKTSKTRPDSYVASSKYSSISSKHYRPYHHCIQKLHYLYDNDWIDTQSFDENNGFEDISTGTGRKTWKAHDVDGFDNYKDCN